MKTLLDDLFHLPIVELRAHTEHRAPLLYEQFGSPPSMTFS